MFLRALKQTKLLVVIYSSNSTSPEDKYPMDLATYESQKNMSANDTEGESSFVHDEVHHIKQKIETRKAKRKKLKIVLGSLLSIIVILTALVAYSQYTLYKLSREELGADSKVAGAPKTAEEIIQAVRKHILLPAGDPQIAEVQDVAKLKETQAFFKDAQNGDIVIVYPTMIYIYRPGADIVVAASDISGAGQEKP